MIKFWVFCSIACMKQRFVTSVTCKNVSCKLGLTGQNVITAAIDQWRDRLRSCVHAGGGHFEHVLWNCCSLVLCGSSEHFMKRSILFGAFDGYFVVNVKSWICAHMHFRQGSVATLLMWDGWNSYRHMCCSFLNLTVQTTLKVVTIRRSYRQN